MVSGQWARGSPDGQQPGTGLLRARDGSDRAQIGLEIGQFEGPGNQEKTAEAHMLTFSEECERQETIKILFENVYINNY